MRSRVYDGRFTKQDHIRKDPDHYRHMLMKNLEIWGFCGTWINKKERQESRGLLSQGSFIYLLKTYLLWGASVMGKNDLLTHRQVSATSWELLGTVLLNARNLSCSKRFLSLFYGQSDMAVWMAEGRWEGKNIDGSDVLFGIGSLGLSFSLVAWQAREEKAT